MFQWQRNVVSVLGLAAFIGLAFGSSGGTPSPSTGTQPAATPAAAPRPDTDETVLKELDAQIENIGAGAPTYDSKEMVLLQAAMFSNYAKTIAGAEARENPAVKKKAAELKRRVSQFQVREFPKMRRAWVKAADQAMWESNVDATVGGNAAQTLTLVGGLFASNRNIKQTQDTLSEVLHQLRFKRVNYKWIPSADKFTYYTLKTPADTDVRPE
jgi:hypothetical protein